jgi:hypothetical protein
MKRYNLIYVFTESVIICLYILIGMNGATAQNNSLVINGAYIVLDGGTSNDNINLVINQNNPAGIIRTGGGYIISENQYNYVKWNSGTGTGNYVFPFGVDGTSTNYVPFTFNKTTAGGSDISISTWATDQENMPHPDASSVPAVTNMSVLTDSVAFAIDRFWDMRTTAAVTADLTFSYLGSENTTAQPTYQFYGQRWNGTSWNSQVGPGNTGVTSGIGIVGPIIGQSIFSPWVLALDPVPSNAENINEENSSISVFPNPSEGNFDVTFTGFENQSVDVTIYNVFGNVVQEGSITVGNTNYKENIVLENEASGVYFISVKSSSKQKTEKIIIK